MHAHALRPLPLHRLCRVFFHATRRLAADDCVRVLAMLLKRIISTKCVVTLLLECLHLDRLGSSSLLAASIVLQGELAEFGLWLRSCLLLFHGSAVALGRFKTKRTFLFASRS